MDQAGPSSVSLVFAVLGIALLLASGWWINAAFARFEKIPAHYDWRGRATRMERRAVMAWLLPVAFSVILIALVVLLIVLPAEMINGDPSLGLYLATVLLVGAQVSALMLLSRWARRQTN